MDDLKVCLDRVLPDALYIPENASRVAILKSKRFLPGTTLKVSYIGGTVQQRRETQIAFEEYMKYANLNFTGFGGTGGDVRVSFVANAGAYSVLGTDIFTVPRNQATMNLGFNDPGTSLHEVGHCVGFIHEHQRRPRESWNIEQVIRDLSRPPNNWDRRTIQHNIFDRYAEDQLNGTEFDRESIMLYAIPKRWTLDGFSSEPNTVLSALDKKWLAVNYPGRVVVPEEPDVTPVPPVDIEPKFTTLSVIDLSPRVDSIRLPGEIDNFEIKVEKAGKYVIENVGDASIVLRLFGPNSKTNLVATTNDVGTKDKARISRSLNSGRYFLQVGHISSAGIGPYKLRVKKLAVEDLEEQVNGVTVITNELSPGKYELKRL